MPKATLAAACASIFLAGCATDPATFRDPAGAIQDPDAALVIGHAMYWSVMKKHHPEIEPRPFNWKEVCTAKLKKDVWVIWCPAGGLDAVPGTVLGGGLEMTIAASGKLLTLAIYQ